MNYSLCTRMPYRDEDVNTFIDDFIYDYKGEIPLQKLLYEEIKKLKTVITVKELKQIMYNALMFRGISESIAKFMIDDYIEAELSGQSSHGLSKFLLLDVALKQREGDVELVKECGNYAKFNGHKELGHVAAIACVEKAIELANRHGNSIVAMNNANRYSRIKPFARKIAENGFIGIIMNNGGPSAVAPFGGTTPIFGTNPICFAFPSKKGKPYIFDFSTSKKVWAEIRQAILEKRNLPSDCFYDSNGNVTINPEKAEAVKAFGDAKGYALCYAIEILTGAFVGSKMGSKVNDEYDLGFIFIALDPAMFTDMEEFKLAVDELADEVRNSKSFNNKVSVPGDRTQKQFCDNSASNAIMVEESIFERIKLMENSLCGGIESSNKLN